MGRGHRRGRRSAGVERGRGRRSAGVDVRGHPGGVPRRRRGPEETRGESESSVDHDCVGQARRDSLNAAMRVRRRAPARQSPRSVDRTDRSSRGFIVASIHDGWRAFVAGSVCAQPHPRAVSRGRTRLARLALARRDVERGRRRRRDARARRRRAPRRAHVRADGGLPELRDRVAPLRVGGDAARARREGGRQARRGRRRARGPPRERRARRGVRPDAPGPTRPGRAPPPPRARARRPRATTPPPRATPSSAADPRIPTPPRRPRRPPSSRTPWTRASSPPSPPRASWRGTGRLSCARASPFARGPSSASSSPCFTSPTAPARCPTRRRVTTATCFCFCSSRSSGAGTTRR